MRSPSSEPAHRAGCSSRSCLEAPGNLTDASARFKGGWQCGGGIANLALGAKYAAYVDPDRRAVATVGLRDEVPSGGVDVQQGKVFAFHLPGLDLAKRGDGVLNPFLAGVWGIRNAYVLAYTGGRFALDGLDSSFFDLSLHGDYKFGRLYPLIEMNWAQVLEGGSRFAPAERALGVKLRQEGFDVVNLGAQRRSW